MPSKITKIVSIRHKKKNSLLAYATFELNDDLLIRDVKIIEGKYGLFLSFPARQAEDDDGKKFYISYVQPIRDEDKNSPGSKLAKHLEDEILEAYRKSKRGDGSDEEETDLG